MKRLLTSLAITAASVFGTAKASEPITPQALESFRNEYNHATDVYWTDIGAMYKVSFKLNGRAAYAYYNEDGSWVGTTKNLSSSDLSPKLRANLRRKVKAGYISDLFVLTGNEGNVYFATIETPDTKEVLKSVNGRKWSFYKRIEKN